MPSAAVVLLRLDRRKQTGRDWKSGLYKRYTGPLNAKFDQLLVNLFLLVLVGCGGITARAAYTSTFHGTDSLRRFEIIQDNSIVGVWSGESKAAALDAYARSQGYANFETAAQRDWKDKNISIFAIGSQPVIIEDDH